MLSRFSLSFSRLFLIRQQNAVVRRFIANQSNQISITVPQNKENQLKIAVDDPDVFGTLGTPKGLKKQPFNHSIGSIMESNEDMTESDLKEEKYLSFQPAERKSFRKFEQEVEQLVADRRLREALQVLEVTMKEDKVKPSRDIYSLLIGACGKAGYTKKAFTLYNDMKKRGFEPTDSHLTALFNACANSPFKEDGLARAIKLRRQLTEQNKLLNRQQYHAMIKAFGHCGDLETAFQIADEMASNQLPVTTESLCFLMQGCISKLEDGFSQAILVWRKMRKFRVTPDVFSYNLMLRATRDCGVGDNKENKPCLINSLLLTEGVASSAPNKANKKEKKLLNSGESANLPTLAANNNQPSVLPNLLCERIESNNVAIAVTSLDRCENRLALLGDVDGFLEQMRRDHAQPDIKTFTLLLQTMASDSKQENYLLELMTTFKVKPDVDFFNLLIRKREMRLDKVAAKEALGYLQTYQLYPNIMTFGVLALGCHSVEETKKLMESMEHSGFGLNHEIFGSLLRNAVYRRNCFFVIFLVNKAFELGLTLDERSIKLLARFREESMEGLAKKDHGVKVHKIYSSARFRDGFREFCLGYKKWLQLLEVDLEPHPWQQYQYDNPDNRRQSDPKRDDSRAEYSDITNNKKYQK